MTEYAKHHHGDRAPRPCSSGRGPRAPQGVQGPDRKKGRFGRKTRIALDGVSFAIERGETVAILARTGSGKSTLVRCSRLCYSQTEALPDLRPRVVTEAARSAARDRVSVEASFFKKMSLTENLSYAARYYGCPQADPAQDSRDPRRVGFPSDRRTNDGEPLARHAAEGALARALLTSPVVLLRTSRRRA